MEPQTTSDLYWVIERWRVCWRARWWILGLVVVTLCATFVFQVEKGLGRTWEAQARLGVEGDSLALLEILRARATSGNLHRDLGLASDVSSGAAGAAVMTLKARAQDSARAIEAANRVAVALLDDQVSAYARYQAERGTREAALIAKAGEVRARLTQVEAEHRQLLAAESAPGPGAREGLVEGWAERRLERRLARLEAERGHLHQSLDQLDARRHALAPETAPPRLTLTMIDRAVGATRLPTTTWIWFYWSGIAAFLVGVNGALGRAWYVRVTAHERA